MDIGYSLPIILKLNLMKTSNKLRIAILLVVHFVSTSFLFSPTAHGQDYSNGIGLRLGGFTSGITYQHIGASSGGFEGILSFGYRTFLLTGLYEKHESITGSPGLSWFYGGGGHLGFFQDNGYLYWVRRDGRVLYAEQVGETATVFGIDGILGLDYKFNGAPINIGLDIKPFIDFFNGSYVYFDGALNVRYTF
jgi:hypothetical protein